MSNTIDTSLLLKTMQGETKKAGNSSLGKDDFLKILMTQLQHQDPLNPMQDKDFVAQMATFSTLEQITNMGKSIDQFVSMQQQNKLVSYNQFVGKELNWRKQTDAGDPKTPPVVTEGSGKVASIQMKDNQVLLKLEDGTTIAPNDISEINNAEQSGNMLQASMMIGRTVTYVNDKKEETSAVVKSVSFKDGKTQFQLNDGSTSITESQITKIE